MKQRHHINIHERHTLCRECSCNNISRLSIFAFSTMAACFFAMGTSLADSSNNREPSCYMATVEVKPIPGGYDSLRMTGKEPDIRLKINGADLGKRSNSYVGAFMTQVITNDSAHVIVEDDEGPFKRPTFIDSATCCIGHGERCTLAKGKAQVTFTKVQCTPKLNNFLKRLKAVAGNQPAAAILPTA